VRNAILVTGGAGLHAVDVVRRLLRESTARYFNLDQDGLRQ